MNQYETLARNSGKDNVEETYEEVKRLYGAYLQNDEQLWWQVCNRLGVKADSPYSGGGGGGGGNATDVALADIDMLEERQSINVEGMVGHIKKYPPRDDKPEFWYVVLNDKTGTAWVGIKGDHVNYLKDHDVDVGTFIKVHSAWFNWGQDHDRYYVSANQYAEISIDKDFNPSEYFVDVNEEPMTDGRPCRMEGLVLKATERESNSTGNPFTVLNIASKGGVYEAIINEHHAEVEGHLIELVGRWSENRKGIMPDVWNVQDESTPLPSEEVKAEGAETDITRTLKSFKRLPKGVVLKKLAETVGDERSATKVLADMQMSGKVSITDDDVVWTGD